MSSSTNIQIESKNGCLWILMPRSIDTTNNLQLQDAIEKNLSDAIDRVVLDCTNIVRITSVAIGLIMRLRGIVEKSGCSMYFINVSEPCLDQLETVNLHKILPVLD